MPPGMDWAPLVARTRRRALYSTSPSYLYHQTPLDDALIQGVWQSIATSPRMASYLCVREARHPLRAHVRRARPSQAEPDRARRESWDSLSCEQRAETCATHQGHARSCAWYH